MRGPLRVQNVKLEYDSRRVVELQHLKYVLGIFFLSFAFIVIQFIKKTDFYVAVLSQCRLQVMN